MEHTEHQDHGGEDSHAPHIAGMSMYLGVFGILIVLTLLTVAISYVHLGSLNLGIAIVIATMKAALVVLFFMHLWWDDKFNSLILVGAVLFGGVFLVYTLNDTAFRTAVDPEKGARYSPATGQWAAGSGEGVGEMVRASGGGHGSHHEPAASGDNEGSEQH